MGSPLVVELAEIRVVDVENTALTTYKGHPNTYRHFVDDGIGDFRDKSHADGFLNSLTDDLQSHPKKNWTQSTQPPYKMNTPLTETNASWTVSNKN